MSEDFKDKIKNYSFMIFSITLILSVVSFHFIKLDYEVKQERIEFETKIKEKISKDKKVSNDKKVIDNEFIM